MIHIPRDDLDYTVEAGLRALIERRLLVESGDGALNLQDDGPKVAAYYANSVAHLFDAEMADMGPVRPGPFAYDR